jgi:hypothetical protein
VTGRYEAAEMGPDDPFPGMWGVRDHRHGGAWVMAGGEVDRYPMPHSAEQAARSLRYVGESRIHGHT